jgi:hypothetical protein
MQDSVEVQEYKPESILNYVNQNRGMLWERIETFREDLSKFDQAITHKCGEEQSEICKQVYPIKQTLEGGLYTRQMFIPKGHFIISMIHKQQHPSFLLEGKVSYLTDSGELVTIKAPHIIFTQIGTQRVLYMHEDTKWCCVYKTEAKTFEDAEADVYTEDYKTLPISVIKKEKLLCQDYF